MAEDARDFRARPGDPRSAPARPPVRLSVQDPAPVSDGSTAAEALARSLDLARLADRLGYARFWMSEHHGALPLGSVAPEVALARVGAATTQIRIGAGGIILPYYAPLKVAEVFHTLQAFYPGRVDLGLARPAGNPPAAAALLRDRGVEPVDDFPDQLTALLAFLGERAFAADDPFGRIHVAPAAADHIPVWLLGSSVRSATLAAQFGLSYVYSHWHNPLLTRQAAETYQRGFTPSRPGDRPRTLVLVGVLCAETQAEADRLHGSVRLFFQRARSGDLRPFADPSQVLRELADVGGGAGPEGPGGSEGEWPHVLVGTPESVRRDLLSMADVLGADEFMVQTICWDHAARLRSYELLAEVMQLGGGPPTHGSRPPA